MIKYVYNSINKNKRQYLLKFYYMNASILNYFLKTNKF